MNRKKENGFTILEVVIAMFLMTTVGVAVFTSFVNASRWANPTELAAIYDARGTLDQLYEWVRQDTWAAASSALCSGTYAGPFALNGRTYSQTSISPATYSTTFSFDGRAYTQTYVVSSVSLGGINDAYRKLVVTNSWTN